jgi:hypothetical protein
LPEKVSFLPKRVDSFANCQKKLKFLPKKGLQNEKTASSGRGDILEIIPL